MWAAKGAISVTFTAHTSAWRWAGALHKPFLGGAIGIALYFLLASGLLDIQVQAAEEPYYYGFAAFLAGFSERFATVILGVAGNPRVVRSETLRRLDVAFGARPVRGVTMLPDKTPHPTKTRG